MPEPRDPETRKADALRQLTAPAADAWVARVLMRNGVWAV